MDEVFEFFEKYIYDEYCKSYPALPTQPTVMDKNEYESCVELAIVRFRQQNLVSEYRLS